MFSDTVYAGMNILASLGKLRYQAYMTADFVKKVNDAFDVLNVRSYGKKAASPISANSMQHLKVLSDMKAYSESWYVNVKGKKYRPPCFDGLIQDSNVITAIYDGLVKKGPLKFLLTGRLNQDCLENIFSQIRSEGGQRFNPSAREFRFAYINLCSTLMHSFFFYLFDVFLLFKFMFNFDAFLPQTVSMTKMSCSQVYHICPVKHLAILQTVMDAIHQQSGLQQSLT